MMESLNRAFSQLQGFYRSMTPIARLTTGALAVVVVLGLGYLGLHQGQEPLVDLTHGAPLSVGQMTAIADAFDKANLKGYEIRGNAIFVSRARQSEFASALADAKVLTQDFGDAQLDAINGGSVFDIGSDREKERIKIAKQNKLQQTICESPGIAYAKVIFDVDNKPVGFKDKVMTALVSVKRADGSQIDEATISAINMMVVHAYAGLKPENVAVRDLNGRIWCGDPRKNAGAEGNSYLSLKRICEQDLKAKILDALCYIPSVKVAVNVELDRKVSAVEKPAAQPAAQSAVAANKPIEGVNPAPFSNQENRSAPPDTSYQLPSSAKVIDALLGGTRAKDTVPPSARNSVPEEQVEKEVLALAPISARVSVFVPASHFKTIWQGLNPVEPGHAEKVPDQAAIDRIRIEESETIQRSIAPLLPLPKGLADAKDMITVTTFLDMPVQEPPPPDMAQVVLNWLTRYGSTAGIVGLGLICLLMLRSIVRGVASAPKAVPASEDAEAFDELSPDEQDDVYAGPSKHRIQQPSPALREDLSAFVEEDPEKAANILRNWIGQAS